MLPQELTLYSYTQWVFLEYLLSIWDLIGSTAHAMQDADINETKSPLSKSLKVFWRNENDNK